MNKVSKIGMIVLNSSRLCVRPFINGEESNLATDLFEQELFLNASLKEAAVIRRQIQTIPPLAVNQKAIKWRRERLAEVEAEVAEHARCRSQLADAIGRNVAYAKLLDSIERQQNTIQQRKK